MKRKKPIVGIRNFWFSFEFVQLKKYVFCYKGSITKLKNSLDAKDEKKNND